jgi:hypothetical protein
MSSKNWLYAAAAAVVAGAAIFFLVRAPQEAPSDAASSSQVGGDEGVAPKPAAAPRGSPRAPGGGGGGGESGAAPPLGSAAGASSPPSLDHFLSFLRGMRDLTLEANARVMARAEELVRQKGEERASEEVEMLKAKAQEEIEEKLRTRFGIEEAALAACHELYQGNEEVQQTMEDIQRAIMGDEACVSRGARRPVTPPPPPSSASAQLTPTHHPSPPPTHTLAAAAWTRCA